MLKTFEEAADNIEQREQQWCGNSKELMMLADIVETNLDWVDARFYNNEQMQVCMYVIRQCDRLDSQTWRKHTEDECERISRIRKRAKQLLYGYINSIICEYILE